MPLRLLKSLQFGVRGGWKICDFTPDILGGAPVSRCALWKLYAPGSALVVELAMLTEMSSCAEMLEREVTTREEDRRDGGGYPRLTSEVELSL